MKSYTDRIKALVSRPPGAGPPTPELPPLMSSDAASHTDVLRTAATKPPSGPVILSTTKIKKARKAVRLAGNKAILRGRRTFAVDDWRVIGLTVASVALSVVTLVLVWILVVIRPKMQAHIAQQQSQIERQAKQTEELQASLAAKEQELIRAHSAVGVLKIETTPPGAAITFAGRTGVSPTNFTAVTLGTYTLTARLDGYSDFSQTILLTNDAPIDLAVPLSPSYGQLSIASDPPGATFFLERHGKVVQTGPTPATLDQIHVGKYRLRIKKGEAEHEATIEVARNQKTDFKYQLKLGRLRVDSDPPGADVILKGRTIGKTPLLITEVLEGPVTIELRRHKFLPKQLTAHVTVGQEANAAVKLEPNLGPPKGKDFTSSTGFEMVWLNAGYWVARHEVTQIQFFTVMGVDPSATKGRLRPVDSVSWIQATAFCEKLTKTEDDAESLPAGFRFSLPTEREWTEFAGPHSGGVAVLGSPIGTTDVSRSPANSLGLRGVWGNVWEWCQDSDGSGRVLRGGGWTPIYDGLKQIADRTTAPENETNPSFGFRVVLKPTDKRP